MTEKTFQPYLSFKEFCEDLLKINIDKGYYKINIGKLTNMNNEDLYEEFVQSFRRKMLLNKAPDIIAQNIIAEQARYLYRLF